MSAQLLVLLESSDRVVHTHNVWCLQACVASIQHEFRRPKGNWGGKVTVTQTLQHRATGLDAYEMRSLIAQKTHLALQLDHHVC